MGGICSPEEYVYLLTKPFQIDGSLKYAKISLITVLLSGIAAYHLLIINGHGNPDAVCEGLVSYTGSDWALACGRWATRYLNGFSFDIIMPGIWISIYMLTVFAIVILLAKMWNIRSKVSMCLISALLAVNPAVIEQSLLQYMFLVWGVSNILSVLVVYLIFRCKSRCLRFILAPMLMAIAFGLYQVSVATVCMCFFTTLIINLLYGEKLKNLAIKIFNFAISSLLAVAVYFAVLICELSRYGIGESGRVQEFSFGEIFSSLSTTIPEAYKTFYNFFADYFFYRKSIYTGLALIIVFFFLVAIVKLIKSKNWPAALAATVLFCLLPAFSNITKIIFPDTEIKNLMQFQNLFVVPFGLSIIESSHIRWKNVKNSGHCLACLAIIALLWGYTASANATYSVYELSYRHINFMTESILDRIYSMPEYSTEDTIVFAGFIDDTELRNSISAYKFAYGQYDNLAFWTDAGTGLRQSRNNYLLNYFGFNGGFIKGTMHGEYNEAVSSKEFKEMGIFPAQDSIKKFGDMIIVKLSEDPPLFD